MTDVLDDLDAALAAYDESIGSPWPGQVPDLDMMIDTIFPPNFDDDVTSALITITITGRVLSATQAEIAAAYDLIERMDLPLMFSAPMDHSDCYGVSCEYLLKGRWSPGWRVTEVRDQAGVSPGWTLVEFKTFSCYGANEHVNLVIAEGRWERSTRAAQIRMHLDELKYLESVSQP